LDVSAGTLIADGVRNFWEEKRLAEALKQFLDFYIVPNPDPELCFQELSLSEEEQAFLDRVDGGQTLQQLLLARLFHQRRPWQSLIY